MPVRTDKSLLLWGREASYGTPPTVGWERFGYHDTAFLPDPENSWSPMYSFFNQKRAQMPRNRITLTGSIPNIKLQNGDFLPILFTGNPLDPYDPAPIPSFSLQSGIYDTSGQLALGRMYVGGRVNRATISAREGEELTLTIDEMMFTHMWQSRVTGGVARYLNYFPAVDPGLNNSNRWLYSGATIIAFGQVIGHLKSFSITINNGLQPLYGISLNTYPETTNQPIRIIQGPISYKLTFELDMVDTNTDFTFWDYLMQNGGTPLTGSTFSAIFTNGERTLLLSCGPTPQVTKPAMVFEKVDFPMDVLKGYYPAIFTADVDAVTSTVT